MEAAQHPPDAQQTAPPLSVSTQFSSQASIPELVDLAERIWQYVKLHAVSAAGPAALLKQVQQQYKDFGQTFPVPLRWMVQPGDFDAKVFERFLHRCMANGIKDKRAFLQTQAEYAVMLYDRVNPVTRSAPRRAEVESYRTQLVKQLTQEDDEFKTMLEETEVEVKQIDAANRRERVSALLAELGVAQPAPDGAPPAGPDDGRRDEDVRGAGDARGAAGADQRASRAERRAQRRAQRRGRVGLAAAEL